MAELHELTVAELESLLKRLAVHASCRMRRLYWRGAYLHKGGSVPGGHQPADIAADAIAKMLDGTRPWNKESYPDLEDALMASIDSDIYHLCKSFDNRKMRRDTTDSGDRFIEYVPCKSDPDPLRLLTDNEWRNNFHEDVLKEISGEERLKELFECLENEITKPADIAIIMQTTTDEVNNLKKRLRRKLDKLEARYASPSRRKTK